MLSKLMPSWIAAKMMSPDQDDPSKFTYIFALPAQLTYNLQTLWHTLLTSATALHHPWWHIRHSQCWFKVKSIYYPPLNHWQPLRPQNVIWSLLVAKISCHRCGYNPDANSTHSCPGWEHWCWSQPMGSRNHADLAGEWWLDNTMGR